MMTTYLIETIEGKMIVRAKDKEEAMWKAFLTQEDAQENAKEAIDEYYYDNYQQFASNVDSFGRFYSDKLSLIPVDVLLAMAGAKHWEDVGFVGRRFVAYILWRDGCEIAPMRDTVIVM